MELVIHRPYWLSAVVNSLRLNNIFCEVTGLARGRYASHSLPSESLLPSFRVVGPISSMVITSAGCAKGNCNLFLALVVTCNFMLNFVLERLSNRIKLSVYFYFCFMTRVLAAYHALKFRTYNIQFLFMI
jgi:hypothetical protein